MRKGLLTAAISLALTPVASAATETRYPGWPKATLAVSGSSVVMGWTGTTVYPSGYSIYRADTAAFPFVGATMTGKRRSGIALRTSAGPVTSAVVGGSPDARHLLLASGNGFAPQIVYCCRSNTKDFPVETSGRSDAPRALVATIDGKVVRFVSRRFDGTYALTSRHVDDAPGEPFGARTEVTLDMQPLPGRLALAPGAVAWVDGRDTETIRTATIAPGAFTPVPGPTIAIPGTVRRLHIDTTTVVALTFAGDRFRLLRFDGPAFAPTLVWVGTAVPGPIAVNGGVVVLAVGSTLRSHVAGGPTRVIRTLRTPASAVATDGEVAAATERIRLSGPARRRVTAITVTPVQPLPAGLGR